MHGTDFDRWVASNNISADYEFAKGWWDYVELIRRLSTKFDLPVVGVVGHYVVNTPPPEERLPMPAVALARDGVEVALKWDFGSGSNWPRKWTVSVSRRSPYLGPTFGLFDVERDLQQAEADGLMPSHLFGPYAHDPSRFTCEVEDEWDVAALLTLVLHEV